MKRKNREIEEVKKSSRRTRKYVKRIGRTLALVGAGMIGYGVAQVLRKDSV